MSIRWQQRSLKFKNRKNSQLYFSDVFCIPMKNHGWLHLYERNQWEGDEEIYPCYQLIRLWLIFYSGHESCTQALRWNGMLHSPKTPCGTCVDANTFLHRRSWGPYWADRKWHRQFTAMEAGPAKSPLTHTQLQERYTTHKKTSTQIYI